MEYNTSAHKSDVLVLSVADISHLLGGSLLKASGLEVTLDTVDSTDYSSQLDYIERLQSSLIRTNDHVIKTAHLLLSIRMANVEDKLAQTNT